MCQKHNFRDSTVQRLACPVGCKSYRLLTPNMECHFKSRPVHACLTFSRQIAGLIIWFLWKSFEGFGFTAFDKYLLRHKMLVSILHVVFAFDFQECNIERCLLIDCLISIHAFRFSSHAGLSFNAPLVLAVQKMCRVVNLLQRDHLTS